MAKVRIDLADVVGSVEALNILMTRELPTVAAWRLGKVSRKLNRELADYNEARNKLVLKYAIEAHDVNEPARVADEHLEDFQNEVRTLLAQEIEIEIPTLTIEELGSGPFKPVELAPLWFAIQEESGGSNNGRLD